MIFIIDNHTYKYEMENVARLFFPFEKFEFTDKYDPTNSEGIYTGISPDKTATAYVDIQGKRYEMQKYVGGLEAKEAEYELAVLLFNCLHKLTGYITPWGILTGVRPVKLMKKLMAQQGRESAEKCFKERFFVSEDKIKLCAECAESENRIISTATPELFDLFISIPFCPSRCSYCSFVSHSVEQAKKLIPKYVELLCGEIEETAKIAKAKGLKLCTVYIGGGTPTSISAKQLEKILLAVKISFDISNIREYTVEAGRPDTVTEEKLAVLKANGVTRISINPQTMNDRVLETIGRRHTAEQTVNAFQTARAAGFENINMDLIAGLPGEDTESFVRTMKIINELDPESVTVHSLSMKRASNLTQTDKAFDGSQGKTASEMLKYCYQNMKENGLSPYYMYRQSKTVGNLENVGYSKPGKECLYNVFIMDETHTILACGASAVTKLRNPHGEEITRIFNYKYPYEYINNYETVLNRKKGITEFYDVYGQSDK